MTYKDFRIRLAWIILIVSWSALGATALGRVYLAQALHFEAVTTFRENDVVSEIRSSSCHYIGVFGQRFVDPIDGKCQLIRWIDPEPDQ